MMNQKVTILIMIILLFTLSLNVSAVNIKDVPGDHWAYESVKELVEKGYLNLYQDGTFNGNKNVTRYELAVLISRIIDNIESGETKPEEQDLETLRKLSIEFRQELVDIAEVQDKYKIDINKLEKEDVILKEELGIVKADISSIKSRIDSLEEKIVNLEDKLTNIDTNTSNLVDNLLTLKKSTDQLEQIINENEDNISALENKVDTNMNQINKELNKTELEDRISKLENQIASIEDSLVKVNQAVDKKATNSVASVKKELNSRINQLEDEYSLNLTNLQNKLEETIETLKTENKNYENKVKDLNKENDEYKMYLGVAGAVALLLLIS